MLVATSTKRHCHSDHSSAWQRPSGLLVEMLLQSSASRTSAFRTQRAARAVRDVRMAALSQDELKQQAAFKAVDYVKSGMVVGLGTGSTAAFAVDRRVLIQAA